MCKQGSVVLQEARLTASFRIRAPSEGLSENLSWHANQKQDAHCFFNYARVHMEIVQGVEKKVLLLLYCVYALLLIHLRAILETFPRTKIINQAKF